MTVILEYREILSTGIKKIDDQHKKLYQLINDLFTACVNGYDKEMISTILSDLAEYIDVHFKDEEDIMQSVGYSDFLIHKSEHDKFYSLVVGILKEYELTGVTDNLINDTKKLLVDWLLSHLNHFDKKLAIFIKSQ